jgi:hypothetical protein
MATHAENSLKGTLIRDANINVNMEQNSYLGSVGSSITNIIPSDHDLSDQIDGLTSEFILDPPVAYGTEYLFELYLDGQKLFRSMVPDEPDFYLNPNRVRVVLAPDFTLSSESVLIAKYVDQLQ